MAIAPGTRLGPYEIVSHIGAGGMGEVWKARDTRLDRTVAIKVASEKFSERFEREARAVAALNHPHICTLHDVGPNYLVMEYIDGRPLKGPMPVAEALRLAIQIADALDGAHRKGIVHRDLKPGNILVAKSGVKLLDFGLAKMEPEVAVLPEQAETLTQQGAITGTLQYMAPEQLEGKKADARADIFAFGAVLYEMVTGRRAYEGSSSASVIAKIVGGQSGSLEQLPRGLDHVVRRCLAKDRDERWQSAVDVRHELEWLTEDRVPHVAAPRRNVWRERIVWILAAALLCVLSFLAASWWRSASTGEVTRFTIYPPEKMTFPAPMSTTVAIPQFALSPDGRSIVFAVSTSGAKPMLWLRPMDEVGARPLAGTEQATRPFWSPDSRWVGFFAEGKLKKVPVAGGPAQMLAEGLSDPRGGSWGQDDTILYSPANDGVYRVSAAGGQATAVTRLDTSLLEANHRWPHFLPDGRHFLFTIRSGKTGQRGVHAGSLDGKAQKLLVQSLWSAVFAPPGYLLYLDGDTLVAREFEAASLDVSGQPFTVAERVGGATDGQTAVSASRTGALAYAGAILHAGRLTWFERNGKMLDSVGPEGEYLDFRLSPDEKRLAASLVDRKTNPDIWLTDLARGSTSRFTFGPQLSASPIWSPDGERIVFRANRSGLIEIYQKSAGEGASEQPLLLADALRAAKAGVVNSIPTDWSRDGRYIVYTNPSSLGDFDLWLLALAGGKPTAFLRSPADELHGNFSPDGRFVAYSSNESGRSEVYVRTFPLSDRKWQVSTHGGNEPRWRLDGREIYYLSEDRKLMAVSVGAGPSFDVPKTLFQTRVPLGVNALRTNYVPARDGQRFLVNTQSAEAMPAPITVVLNWTAGLKK